MKLTNLRVGPRLAIAFGAVLTAVLAVFAFALHGQYKISHLAGEITGPVWARAELANRIKEAAVVNARLTTQLLLETDAGEITKVTGEIERVRAENQKTINELEKLLDSPQAREIYAGLGKLRKAHMDARADVIAQAKAGNRPEARMSWGIDGVPTLKAYQKALNEFVLMQRHAAEQALEEMQHTNRRLGLTLIAILSAALTAGICGAIFISRSVTNPLSRAVAIAAGIAQGRFDNEIKIAGHDESAQLMQALTTMQQNLRARADADRRMGEEVASIASAAAVGDFDKRVPLEGKDGFFLELGQRMNRLLDTTSAGMKDLTRVLAALAQGDLTHNVSAQYEGLFAQMKSDTNRTVEALRRIVGHIRESTAAIATVSKEIAQGNTDLSSRTEEQASSLEETASSMEELTCTVRQNAENARQANQLAIGASDVALKGGAVVSQVVTTMGSISESSKKIVEIIGVIDGIAFQTNILALNAAVEAARAGEQGRGFAVVATEVRNLAQRSAAAAKEIKTLIQDSVEKVGMGTQLVDHAGKTMEEVVAAIKRVTEIMAEITAASQEQSSGIEQVNQAITQMDEGTQQNAALVEEATAAAESLQGQAQSLSQAVARFKVAAPDDDARPVNQHLSNPPQRSRAEQLPAPSAERGAAVVRDRRGPSRAKNVARLSVGRAARAAAASAADVPSSPLKTGTDDEWQEF